MTTITELRLPAADGALGTACDRVPSLTCELERAALVDRPDAWLGGADRSTVEAALEADPTVESYASIASGDDRWLYDLAFTAEAADCFDQFPAVGATVLAARMRSKTWTFRVRVTDRNDARRLLDRLAARDVGAEVVAVYEVTDDPASRFGLTPAQHEALVAAIERGYFEIPRETSMQELAADLDVSHQALSERLRRAYATLVTTELDFPTETAEAATN